MRFFALFALLLIVAAAAVLWLRADVDDLHDDLHEGHVNAATGTPLSPPATPVASSAAQASPMSVIVAPADPAPSAKAEATVSDPAAPIDDPAAAVHSYGSLPPIDLQHPQAQAVQEAVRSGEHPERLSPAIAPTPFDRDAYVQDRASYLAVSEPGRAHAAAQPGEGVPRLQRVSPRSFEIRQGSTVELVCQTLPGMPCSFTTYDGGLLSDPTGTGSAPSAPAAGLPALTVAADADGIARVVYLATTGVTQQVNIQAASPVAHGVLVFRIFVLPPEDSASLKAPAASLPSLSRPEGS